MKKARFLSLLCLVFLLSGCTMGSKLKVNFDSNGGSNLSAVSTDGVSIVDLPNDPTREGYLFIGWYYDNESFLRTFNEDSLIINPIIESITVYAQWMKLFSTISFQTNGGN